MKRSVIDLLPCELEKVACVDLGLSRCNEFIVNFLDFVVNFEQLIFDYS